MPDRRPPDCSCVVTSTYYYGAFGAFLIYDISRRSTFNNVGRWMQELNSECFRSFFPFYRFPLRMPVLVS
jgi:GTPase SAR1 family protein